MITKEHTVITKEHTMITKEYTVIHTVPGQSTASLLIGGRELPWFDCGEALLTHKCQGTASGPGP